MDTSIFRGVRENAGFRFVCEGEGPVWSVYVRTGDAYVRAGAVRAHARTTLADLIDRWTCADRAEGGGW